MQPGFALATTAAPERSMAATLRARMAAAIVGMEGAVRPSGPAAQPVVVQLDQVGVAGEHGAHGQVGPLGVAEVAGVLHRHRRRDAAPGRWQLGQVRGQPLVDVEHPAAEPGAGIGAEQVAVVLEGGAAAGRVDQDRRVARHRRHDPGGQPAGVGHQAGVHVQRTAAGTAAPGQRHAGASRLDQPLGRLVDGPLPRVHDTAGEQPHVRSGRLEAAPADRQARQAEPPGDKPGPLGGGQGARAGQEQAVVAEHPVAEALPPRREPAGLGQRRAGAFHQAAERHARRAGRLASPALDAGVHEAHELVVSRRPARVHGAHRRDAAPRRCGLLPGHPVGRAVRQAQAAADARGQLVVEHLQLHGGLTVPALPALLRPALLEA